MRSTTKRALGEDELAAAVTEAFGADASVTAVRELGDGTFNAVWLLDLDPVGPVVLKAAPPRSAPLLTYERRIARTEALVLELAAPAAPVPVLHHAGFDSAGVGGDFLVTSVLGGETWQRLSGGISAAERAGLRHELGRVVAGLHTVRGTGFGYPEPSTGLRGDTWAEAFTAMFDAVLDDADRYGVVPPVPTPALRELVRANRALLDEVTDPVLVHFDLWEGNIMLGSHDGGRSVTGLIDLERAFWGDPHAEFVSLALLGDLADDDPLLDGYREAGGPAELTPRARRRIALYQAYLYLIMLVEAVPRGYRGVKALAARSLYRMKFKQAVRRVAG
ncbi:Predicted kinase, aminoglycoside phosphotransferase (APT) family [Lentzea fradiae]|uniref:Predicted kinase, aminoglycoside phosphotransferase (APT) family n=1 Tax=Lentzea fradiae TaxID=200378 RepID=A0A1G7UVH5_9PSEU|nr:phosphotransferase [Lentzea fradiae]SDG51129.1 Predicted kinase, aminoglycoside phosphotransferase (APT) family [Lentzea fradiae]